MGKSNDVNIILLSSRNAASGINLTAANKIILLEPVYGTKEYRYNIESQAIGRADRIGQKRPIDVLRFIIKDTIEEDIFNNYNL
jgi:SNF2 family DNA or RNA helicase